MYVCVHVCVSEREEGSQGGMTTETAERDKGIESARVCLRDTVRECSKERKLCEEEKVEIREKEKLCGSKRESACAK